MNSDRVIDELRKAMDFYRAMGFEYLPVKGIDIEALLSSGEKPVQAATEAPVDVEPDKAVAMKLLQHSIAGCERCGLSKGRTNIVFGEGSIDADVMFIGEGPGRDEDIQGRPFVGDAGKLLTNLIVKLGMKRDEVYIANIVKCRPPNNRNPQTDESDACIPFLKKQIDIIKPKVIVCLGRVAANALLCVGTPISKMRGTFSKYQRIPVMPTFHPAYLLRNKKDKWLTWNDMQQVMKIIKKT